MIECNTCKHEKTCRIKGLYERVDEICRDIDHVNVFCERYEKAITTVKKSCDKCAHVGICMIGLSCSKYELWEAKDNGSRGY